MGNQLRERWSAGGTALGAWISLRDPIVAETAASLGFDYVCIDLQHGLNDYDGMVNALAAMARTAPRRWSACRGTSRGSSAGRSTPAPPG